MWLCNELRLGSCPRGFTPWCWAPPTKVPGWAVGSIGPCFGLPGHEEGLPPATTWCGAERASVCAYASVM